MTVFAGAAGSRLSVLVLCDDSPAHAPNVLEHIHALRRFSRHRVDLFNPLGVTQSRLLRFEDYDVVVVHYSILIVNDLHLAPWFRERLASFGGLKVQFIQDEYRWVDEITARMQELGIGLLFSSIPPDVAPLVYGPRLPGVDVVPTLTGYVPADLQDRPRQPLHGRSLDVVYRGRSIPYWLGRLGQDKVLIGREFLARAASTDLRCDIAWAEADRIYGDAWYRFLASSRTTLGTESGASIMDFDGSLQARTDEYLAGHPDATFEEVEREILATFEGNVVIQAISPRVFEAAALGTAMVNFAGRYSDVIEPWVHYVPLEKDFSNFNDVAAAIRDEGLLERVAAQAHEDLVRSGRYSLPHFVADFDGEIEARAQPAARRARSGFARAASERLLALEQLRAARSRGPSLLSTQRARALDRAGRDLIRRFPEIDGLSVSAPPGLPPARRERLRQDLLRLAVATAAHLRELRHFGPPFDVRLELEDTGRKLTLVSTAEPSQDAEERATLREPIAAAIRDRRLEEIVWNHSALGVALDFPVPLVVWASLEVGYHVVNGAYYFAGLTELAGRDPDGVIAALDPLLRPRPDEPVHELQGPAAAALRALSAPGHMVGRGTAALRAVLSSAERRRLLRAYLGNPEARAETSLDLVLEDLLKLSLVGQAPVCIELDAEQRTLVYRTNGRADRPGRPLDPELVRALEQIVWDNSAAGSSVTSKTRPRVTMTLEDGIHEFEALRMVARRFPVLAARALEDAASG